jgi:hypothetical protein
MSTSLTQLLDEQTKRTTTMTYSPLIISTDFRERPPEFVRQKVGIVPEASAATPFQHYAPLGNAPHHELHSFTTVRGRAYVTRTTIRQAPNFVHQAPVVGRIE